MPAKTNVSLHSLVEDIEDDIDNLKEAFKELTSPADAPHHCPVNGCDHEGSLASVRSHVNSTDDNQHDWERLADTVEDQAPDEQTNSVDFDRLQTLVEDAADSPEDSPERLENLSEVQELITRTFTTEEDLNDSYLDRVHDKEMVEEKIDAWDGAEFTIKKGSWDHVGQVSYETRKELGQLDTDGDDRLVEADRYQKNYVNQMVVGTPPGAPEDVQEYPPAIGQWLYDVCDNFNSKGETSPGNSSLRQAVMNDQG